MIAKMLLPVLIALHLAAAALIIDSLRIDEQESGHPDQPWQAVEWNPGPGCVAGYANDEVARYWSSQSRRLNATDIDRRRCVNIH